jgi:phosphoenolpyruvate carboxykinase (ATP)
MQRLDARGLAARIAEMAGPLARNETAPVLTQKALAAGEGRLTAAGALAVTTGKFTGRSPKDKYIVFDALTRDRVWWDNSAALSGEHFDTLLGDVLDAIAGKPLYAQDLLAGADPAHRFAVSVFTETAWHALFIRNLLIRSGALTGNEMPVTILHAPSFRAYPDRHGTRTDTVVALDLSRNIVVIAGTAYAGEIKKSVFSLFNFHAPARGVMPMHCSANIGEAGDVALFFGLSGTGKTTLSTDPRRQLIGDDEHGWSADGVFNLEGGCYAKTANLSEKSEPEIFGATGQAGTVLENVVLDPATNLPDFADLSLTENGRAAYELGAVPNVAVSGTGGTPQTVVFLAADAFGVLPPVARLTPAEAVYHFLSGYTAKLAGTERGVTAPVATFSACFGAPFMSLHPKVYGAMLETRLRDSGAACWLINTGWTGGAYGVGRRIDIATTRTLVNAALSGALDRMEMRIDPNFGFAVPVAVPGIAAGILDPRETWVDKAAYDAAAARLVALFAGNFEKFSLRQAAE